MFLLLILCIWKHLLQRCCEETSMFVWGPDSQSPEFGTVWHWRPPDIHIFHTDPSPV